MQPTAATPDRPNEPTPHRRALTVLIGLGALVWLFFVSTTFSGLTINDGYDYANAARNLLDGNGLLWESRTVQEFASLPEGAPLSRAQFNNAYTRQALYPLALAAAFSVGGQSELTIIAVDALFFLAAIPLVYLLAWRLFGYWAAVVAGGLYVMNAKMIFYSAAGGPFTLYAFLLLAATLLLMTGRTWKAWIGGGVCAGLIWWTKGVGGVVAGTLVGCAAALRWSDTRWRAGLAALAGAGLVVLLVGAIEPSLYPPAPPVPAAATATPAGAPVSTAPAPAPQTTMERWKERLDVWLARTAIFSDELPGHTFERSLSPSSGGLGDDRMKALAAKVRRNLAEIASVLFLWLTAPLVVWLFWIGGIGSIRAPLPRRLFLLVIVLFAMQTVVCAVFFVMHRYFHVFIPLALVLAAGAIVRIGAALGRRVGAIGPRAKTAAVVAVVLALSWPFCVIAGLLAKPVVGGVTVCDVKCWYAKAAQGERLARVGAFVRAHTGKDDVVVCDAPWVSVWQGNRTSIWLPTDVETLAGLRRRVQVDWLLFTFEYWRGLDYWKEWIKKSGENGGTLDGFAFAGAYQDGDYVAYLYRALPPEAEAPVSD